jgi:thiamine-monophosphate kinase
VALVLPEGFEGALELVGAMEELAESSGVTIAGGDDYELLFTIAPERREAAEAAAPVSWLGDVRVGSGLVLLDADGRPVEGLRGFEH